MKLIFLYGPPAVGKLTIAKELEKKTGFKVLHNPLVWGLMEVVMDPESRMFSEEKNKLYIKLLMLAAKANRPGMIFTFCYNHPKNIGFVKKLISGIKKYGGEVYFVQILADESELRKRVKCPARKKYNKINSIKVLEKRFRQKEFFEKIPHVRSLSVDNTTMPPKKAAQMIAKYCGITEGKK